MYKHLKRINLLIDMSSTSLVVIGTIVGGITLNPIPLGTISGSGLLLKTFSEIKNYKKKIEISKFAYTTYQKILVELRSYLRGNDFNHAKFKKTQTILKRANRLDSCKGIHLKTFVIMLIYRDCTVQKSNPCINLFTLPSEWPKRRPLTLIFACL